jgi:hypothetical protein
VKMVSSVRSVPSAPVTGSSPPVRCAAP